MTQKLVELKTIAAISRRAKSVFDNAGVPFDHLSTTMDIEKVHEICPLNLDALLDADQGNFGHDITGIYNHFNRETGQLENCFVPRYSIENVEAEAKAEAEAEEKRAYYEDMEYYANDLTIAHSSHDNSAYQSEVIATHRAEK